MSALDDWAAEQWAGMTQGAGDVARGAWADIGNAYQAILTQGSPVGPPAPLTGDMVTTHDPLPEAAANRFSLEALAGNMQVQGLLDAHEIAQHMAADELEHAIAAPEHHTEPEMDR